MVSDVAVALLELAGRDASGVLHVAGPDAMSRYELACLVARAHGISPERLRRGSSGRVGWSGPRTVCSTRAARGLLSSPLRGPRQLAQADDRR